MPEEGDYIRLSSELDDAGNMYEARVLRVTDDSAGALYQCAVGK